MHDIDSRAVRYFVAVAEELNFARASERLNIAAPALSRAISKLEAQLGTQLFERSPRRVTLTPAGEVLLAEGKPALAALDGAGRRAMRAGTSRHTLVLVLNAERDGGLLRRITELYEHDQPGLPLDLRLCRRGEQAQSLRDGHADVSLLPAPFDERGLDSEIIFEEPQFVAVASDHALAKRREIALDDLAVHYERTAEHDIWRSRSADSADADFGGIDDLTQALKLVELGQMAKLMPLSVVHRYPRREIAYRPVTDAPSAALAVAWPRSSKSLPVAAFVRAACRAGEERQALAAPAR